MAASLRSDAFSVAKSGAPPIRMPNGLFGLLGAHFLKRKGDALVQSPLSVRS